MTFDVGSCVWVWFLRGLACAVPLGLALALGKLRFVSPTTRLWVWRAAMVKCLLEATGVLSLVPAINELSGPMQTGWSVVFGPMRSAVGTFPIAFMLPMLAVSGIVLNYLLGQARQTRRWLRTTNLASDQNLRDRYHEVARAMDCWSLPPLLESRQAPGPLVAGWPKVGLVLPDIPAGSLVGEEADMLLGHELAHARNKDSFWSVVSWLLIFVFPFQPLAWVAAREQRVVAEQASDSRVVKGLDVAPADYARFLAKASTLWRLESVNGLLSAGMVGSKRLLLRRVSSLGEQSNPAAIGTLCSTVICLVVLAPVRIDTPLTWSPLWLGRPADVPRFDVKTLDPPAPFKESRASSLNNAGQVAVNFHLWKVQCGAGVWTPGKGLRLMNGGSETPCTSAEGISDDGTCAGTCSYPAYGGCLAAYWPGSQVTPVWTGHPGGTPIGGWAIALGRPGEVAGTADLGRAWKQTQDGRRVWLGLPQGWTTWSVVRGGNSDGCFCGAASSRYFWQDDSAPLVAVLWEPSGNALALGWLPGDVQSFAHGINRGLTVVGWSGGPDRKRAFRWTRQDGMQLLQAVSGYANSQALKVNSSGWIVGSAWNTNSEKVGVLWSPDGRAHLLDTLLNLKGVKVAPG